MPNLQRIQECIDLITPIIEELVALKPAGPKATEEEIRAVAAAFPGIKAGAADGGLYGVYESAL